MIPFDDIARAIVDEAERRRNIARASALMPHITPTGLAWRLAAIDDAEALTLDLLEQVRAYVEPQ